MGVALPSCYDETFGSGDGGYTVTDSGTESPWNYIAAGGRWEVNGSKNLGVPSWSGLFSPSFY